MNRLRLMVIGLDAVSLSLLDAFRQSCPAIRKVMREGTTGRALPCFPVYTPTNWAALSTGAGPAGTGAAGWENRYTGELMSTFDRRAIQCDTIFDAAARAKLKTLAIAYPSAHPTRSRSNMVLAPLDNALVSNCLVRGKILPVEFDGAGRFGFVLLEAPEAASGAALARAVGATEDGASLSGPKRRASVRTVRAYLFRSGRNCWKLGFTSNQAAARVSLRSEVWSEPIPIRVETPGRPGRCVVRVVVFDGGRRLAVSEAYDIGALGKPAALARTVYERLGPPIEHSVFFGKMYDLFGEGTEDRPVARLARRELTEQVDWIVKAASLTQEICPYDVFYLHYHHPDTALHRYLAAAEGSRAFSRKQQAVARAEIRMRLKLCDRVVAGLLRLAGRETTVLLVSDHGVVPSRYRTDLTRRLVETGLTTLRKGGAIDRTRSLAWRDEHVLTWVRVNARRDSRRYREIQAKVIDALLDWKTDRGERVVAAALRRKDSHLLGYEGEECADVTFHYNSGFSWFGDPARAMQEEACECNHGPQMPVSFSKLSDNMAFFTLKGPRFGAGRRWDEDIKGHIRLVDLVPTMCHAAGVPSPRGATGAVRHELLK